ncbi:MAG: orotate phosphoribosyltransferase [Saprospiraceae bacterium]|nr:orotate phosphoribosyltransferase [Candidatus Vicinibacter affinis]MBP6522201.1 orotate phosphoribosyltransferase [Saprospiraceae bacterium]MBK6572472.1 orotate phosphoribosyltransferase [Candidatus Vicinibacter affinis]MBK6825275.1 orotate phosphoribosyltransferase [Candidatus Vicinibacter affinis]MBK7304255.1 orotate phosphoribosyltransferase [Candidatus Vicinibacter affinis]
MNLANNIADRLMQINAIKLNAQNPFTWASGLKSPIYCDNRLILSFPEVRKIVVAALVREALSFEGMNAVAGVATAGIAWGALVADRLDLPFCYVRSKPKEHGMKNLIEGELPENSKVLVIEDLISTGGSSMEAVQALLQPSYEVVGVLSIFQYGFLSAVEKFNDKNVKFKSLTDFQTLLVRALQANYISSADYENLKSWNLNPKLWSDQFINHN